MAIIRNLRVDGALYEQVDPPKLDPKFRNYTSSVRRADGSIARVHSRLPDGPFTFTEARQ